MPDLNNQPVSWVEMDKKQQQELLMQILQYLVEWRPIPQELLKPLPTELLYKIQELAQQLKAEGLAGPRHRTSERVKALIYQAMRKGLLPQGGEPTPDQVLEKYPEMRQQVLAQESQQIREAENRTALNLQRALAGV